MLTEIPGSVYRFNKKPRLSTQNREEVISLTRRHHHHECQENRSGRFQWARDGAARVCTNHSLSCSRWRTRVCTVLVPWPSHRHCHAAFQSESESATRRTMAKCNAAGAAAVQVSIGLGAVCSRVPSGPRTLRRPQCALCQVQVSPKSIPLLPAGARPKITGDDVSSLYGGPQLASAA